MDNDHILLATSLLYTSLVHVIIHFLKTLPNQTHTKNVIKRKINTLPLLTVYFIPKKKNSDLAVGALNLDATHQMVCINYAIYPLPPIFTAEFQTTSPQTKRVKKQKS